MKKEKKLNKKWCKLFIIVLTCLLLILPAAQSFISVEKENIRKNRHQHSPVLLNEPYITWKDSFDDHEWIEMSMSEDYELVDGYAQIQNTYPSWTDPAWTKMKQITINNLAGTPLSNYAISFIVQYDSDMKPGFEDIRFKHEDFPTSYLDYWIETKNIDEAVVWVKIPSIPTGQSTAYLFYGNPTASDESNYYTVFSDWEEEWPNDEQISYHAYTEGAWDSDVAYGNNKFLVAWEEGKQLPIIKQEIRGTLFNSDGSTVTGAEDFKIYGGNGIQYLDQNPSIAFGGNKFFVAWENYENPLDPTSMDIMGRLVSLNGGTGNTLNICIASNCQADPNVAFDSINDQFCIVWEDARNNMDNYDIYGKLYTSTGGSVGGQKQICTTGNSQAEPWVTFDSINNQYMIVWEEGVEADIGPFDIWMGLFDSNLNPLSSPIKLADGDSNTDYNYPCVAFCEETQRFLVTWNDGDISNEQWYGNIWGVILDNTGSVIVDTFEIKSGNFIRSDIVPYLSSSFFVSYDGGGKIWGKLISSDGEVFDNEIQLSASSSAEADWANLATGNGKIFTTWEDERVNSYSLPDAFGNIWSLNIPSGSEVSCSIGDEKNLLLTALITSKNIDPDDLVLWHNFSATFTGSISFNILDENGNSILVDVNSGEDLSSIDPLMYPKIRLQAIFSRDTPSSSPLLDQWCISYLGIDEQPPETTISDIIGTQGENGWYISNVAMYLVATDGPYGTGVNETYFKIDESQIQQYNKDTGIELPPQDPYILAGEWDVYYWSVDKAGNIEDMNGPEHIKIDKAPPHCQITQPADRELVTGDFWVSTTATDEGSGVSYVLFDIGPPYDDPVIVETDDPPGSGIYSWECTRHPKLQWKHIIAQVYDEAGHMYEDNIYVFFFNLFHSQSASYTPHQFRVFNTMHFLVYSLRQQENEKPASLLRTQGQERSITLI